MEEEVIRRAAVADRAFHDLVAGVADDAGRARAMCEFRARVARELDPKRPAESKPVELWEPLDVAVDRELEARRPAITIEMANLRRRRRIASQCGPVQIQLSPRASLRAKLFALVRSSPLSVRELANVFGIEEVTLHNHLRGKTIAQKRQSWYNMLEAVEVVDGLVYIVLRYRPTRKRWGWKFTAAQRAAQFSDARRIG